MRGTARASFDWARRVGASWRGVGGAPRGGIAAELLAEAFGERLARRHDGPAEHARRHDRALGVAAVLAGVPSERLAHRARHRTRAFAEAAAWALSVDQSELAVAVRTFDRAELEWHDGVAAGIDGWSDPARGALFQRGRREARAALARNETWAVVARFRSPELRRAGYADGALGQVDPDRLLLDAFYRAGVHAALTVVRTAGPAAARAEVAAHASAGRRAGCHRSAS